MLYPRQLRFARTFQVQYESNLIGAQCYFFGTTSVFDQDMRTVSEKAFSQSTDPQWKEGKRKDPYLQVTTEDKFNVPKQK